MAVMLSATHRAPSCTERELIAAVRNGEDRAFDELYSRYASRIRSYIFGMVGDHGRAEDIGQEVFISALRRLRATEHPIAFKPWVYEIAKNACIDEFRRTKRSREVPLDLDDDGDDARPAIASSVPSADAAFESKLQLDDLRGAFGGLSEQHHRIIVLRELEGLSYDEIGARMGMSRAMVESTLFRARRRLSEEYQELVSGQRCEQVQMTIDRVGAGSSRSIRVRERRKLARHLSHCQPCRRHAHFMGFDESILKTPSIPRKIAALLPIPWWRLRRSGGGSPATGGEVSAATSSQLSPSAWQSVQAVSRFVDPSAPFFGAGRAAVAAAAVVIAGAGGGIVSSLGAHAATGGAKHALSSAGAAQAGIAVPSRAGSGGAPRSVAGALAGWGGAGGASSNSPGHSSRTSARHATQLSSGTDGSSGSSSSGSPAGSAPSAAGSPSGTAASSSGAPGLPSVPTSSSSLGQVPGGLPKVGLPSLPPVKVPSLPPIGIPPLRLGLPKLPPVTLPPLPKLGLPLAPGHH